MVKCNALSMFFVAGYISWCRTDQVAKDLAQMDWTGPLREFHNRTQLHVKTPKPAQIPPAHARHPNAFLCLK
eukprot:1125963-Rhodomonas_salina.1